eukprot:Tamp_20696.p1 GENE.Tamp_20696~~Tamp_20696.p1  ORF type:complete len:164 (+),score=17.82 Tamp_20696:357-848(+)
MQPAFHLNSLLCIWIHCSAISGKLRAVCACNSAAAASAAAAAAVVVVVVVCLSLSLAKPPPPSLSLAPSHSLCRLHFWAMRQSGVYERSPSFAEYYVKFIGARSKAKRFHLFGRLWNGVPAACLLILICHQFVTCCKTVAERKFPIFALPQQSISLIIDFDLL